MNLLDVFDQTQGFITKWTVSGNATARTITLPLINTRSEGALSYNFTVDWGDGSALSTVTAYNDANRIHTYSANGTYNVEIRGTCEGWSFNYGGDRLKIVAVVYWGDAGGFNGFKYLKSGFYGCANLTSLGTGVILPSGTGILSDGFYNTFSGCTLLTSIPTDLFRYNTACTDFSYCFYGCTKLQVLSTTFYEPGEETTRFLNQIINFTDCFYRSLFGGVQGTAPNLWTCDFGETITLSTAPVTDWAPGDTITGQTSGATALVVSKVSSLVYKIKQHIGTFTLGEIVGVTGVPTKLAAQDGTHPTFSGMPISTACFGGAGNSLTSLSNYASIPAQWE